MSAERIKSLDEAFKLMQQIPFASENKGEVLYDCCTYVVQDIANRYLNGKNKFNLGCIMGCLKYINGSLERRSDEIDKGFSELVLDMLNKGLTEILIKGKFPDEES